MEGHGAGGPRVLGVWGARFFHASVLLYAWPVWFPRRGRSASAGPRLTVVDAKTSNNSSSNGAGGGHSNTAANAAVSPTEQEVRSSVRLF
jgi:hypothetical protein